MIKVFTTSDDPSTAGSTLTKKIEDWQLAAKREINIVSMHTTSNSYGFMITVLYKLKNY